MEGLLCCWSTGSGSWRAGHRVGEEEVPQRARSPGTTRPPQTEAVRLSVSLLPTTTYCSSSTIQDWTRKPGVWQRSGFQKGLEVVCGTWRTWRGGGCDRRDFWRRRRRGQLATSRQRLQAPSLLPNVCCCSAKLQRTQIMQQASLQKGTTR